MISKFEVTPFFNNEFVGDTGLEPIPAASKAAVLTNYTQSPIKYLIIVGRPGLEPGLRDYQSRSLTY